METNSATATDQVSGQPVGSPDRSSEPVSSEWPVVPPVPTPTPPPPPPLDPGPRIGGGNGTGRVLLVDPDARLIPATRLTVPVTRASLVGRPGAAIALRTRPIRRAGVAPSRAENQVWQPRFAYTAAAVMAVGLAAVALPLWLALYRAVDAPQARLADVVPLGMMLLGGFLSAVTAWVIIVEMRARVRMVDALGRTGEHEAPGAPMTGTGLLRPFIQVPAQVALLGVALSLFVGATVIAL